MPAQAAAVPGRQAGQQHGRAQGPDLDAAARRRLVAIPNGVDTTLFCPPAPGTDPRDALPEDEQKRIQQAIGEKFPNGIPAGLVS